MLLQQMKNLGTDELNLCLREANSMMTIAKTEMKEAKRFNERVHNGRSIVRAESSIAVYRERKSTRDNVQLEIDSRREDIVGAQDQVESILNRYAFQESDRSINRPYNIMRDTTDV